jgi:hypothetical protein
MAPLSTLRQAYQEQAAALQTPLLYAKYAEQATAHGPVCREKLAGMWIGRVFFADNGGTTGKGNMD